MRYLELKIQASEQGVEQITALLLGMGITEMSIDDPHDMDDILQKKHEYGWDYIEDNLKENLDREPVISLYFDEADPKAQQMAVMVKDGISALQRRQQAGEFGQQADLGSLTVTENIVDDGDWKDKWKEFFKPTKVTDRIVVKPTWEEYTPKEDELVIEIDPGMAFGTGTHETTSLCMKLMEKYLGDRPEEKKILDVGCGSGILSICGALLGSRDILGIEIDEDAVRVAHENVEENHVEDAVKVIQGDLTKGVDFMADVIVANLMADLVMLLSADARKHLTADGVFISSGILVEKEEKVSAAIREAGFRIVEIAEDGEWCAIAAVPGGVGQKPERKIHEQIFVAPEDVGAEYITVENKEDLHHMHKVLRLKTGDEIDVSDGDMWEYHGRIESLEPDCCQVEILDKQKFSAEPDTKIILFQGIPKQGKMELIVQKAVELGACGIVPVFMDRTVVTDKGNFGKKIQRWQKVSNEAVKQCKRGIIPQVEVAVKMPEVIRRFAGFDLVLFPYENEDGTTIKDVLRPLAGGSDAEAGSIGNSGKSARPEKIAIIIGPEGGFSEKEAAQIVEAGGKSVSLGKTTLRTETAGLAAIAMTLYELEL